MSIVLLVFFMLFPCHAHEFKGQVVDSTFQTLSKGAYRRITTYRGVGSAGRMVSKSETVTTSSNSRSSSAQVQFYDSNRLILASEYGPEAFAQWLENQTQLLGAHVIRQVSAGVYLIEWRYQSALDVTQMISNIGALGLSHIKYAEPDYIYFAN